MSTAVAFRSRVRRTSPIGAAGGPGAPAGERRRVAPLDGLRGLALVAVLAYHVSPSTVRGGFLGVETFFVLSGYLLAGLLLDEHARTGVVDGIAYATRRVRRIAPALLALLAGLLVLGPVLAPDDAHRLGADIVSALSGVANWHLIAEQSSYFERVGRPSLVRHLWSVAVEVQFYALCPFVLAWVVRRRRTTAIRALAAGVGLSATAMAVLYRSGDPSRAYYGTDARVGALLAGVLLAVALDGARRRDASRPVARWAAVAGPTALTLLGVLYLVADDRARLSYPLAFLAAQAATAVVILAALRPGPVAHLLGSGGLRWLGRRSYGIYLWHWPVVVLLRPGIDVEWPPVVAGAVGVGVAVALGALSYGLVERPLLAARPGTPDLHPPTVRIGVVAAVVAALGLSALFVNLPRSDPLADTLRAGRSVLAAQPPPLPARIPTTADTVPPTTAPPAAAVDTTVAPTVAPAPAPPPSTTPAPAPAPPPPTPEPTPAATPPPVATSAVTAIGDSIMVSAAAALRDRLGPAGFIDAFANRQFPEAITIARRMRDAGTLGAVLVVHLGNNGPVKAADVDTLVREVPPSVTVLLVNLRVRTPWEGAVNATLADAAARHPNVTLVDWYAGSEGHREWFQSDGTHFKTTSGPGARAYAELIVRSMPPPPQPPPSQPGPPTAEPVPSATDAPPPAPAPPATPPAGVAADPTAGPPAP